MYAVGYCVTKLLALPPAGYSATSSAAEQQHVVVAPATAQNGMAILFFFVFWFVGLINCYYYCHEKAAESNLCAVLCAGHFNSVKIYYKAQVRPEIHFNIIIIVCSENNLKIHPSGMCVFVSHISS